MVVLEPIYVSRASFCCWYSVEDIVNFHEVTPFLFHSAYSLGGTVYSGKSINRTESDWPPLRKFDEYQVPLHPPCSPSVIHFTSQAIFGTAINA